MAVQGLALIVYNPAARSAADPDFWLGEVVHKLCEEGDYTVTVRPTRSDSSPEELLTGLVRVGALVRAEHGWRVVERRMRAVVPPTVAESVTARFDALHPRTRQVLAAAALLGREFEWELLAPVTGLDDAAVLASLREATYAGFLDEGDGDDGPAGSAIRFRHALGRAFCPSNLKGDVLPLNVAEIAQTLSERF